MQRLLDPPCLHSHPINLLEYERIQAQLVSWITSPILGGRPDRDVAPDGIFPPALFITLRWDLYMLRIMYNVRCPNSAAD